MEKGLEQGSLLCMSIAPLLFQLARDIDDLRYLYAYMAEARGHYGDNPLEN